MTNAEAIENLKYLISDDCTDTQRDFVKEIKIAIEALEKQIPKKPYWEVYDGWHCKSCGLSVFSDEYFCPICGQEIDWEDDE